MENEFYNNYKLRERFISENGKTYQKVFNYKVEINEDSSNDIEDWMKENHKKYCTNIFKKHKKEITNKLKEQNILFKNNSDYYEFCLDNIDFNHFVNEDRTELSFNNEVILEYNENKD